jgi:hypothetical protein
MKNKLFLLISTVTAFTTSPVLAMEPTDKDCYKEEHPSTPVVQQQPYRYEAGINERRESSGPRRWDDSEVIGSTLTLRGDINLDSKDPALVAELQRLGSEYLKNPKQTWTSLVYPSEPRLVSRCLWDVEKALFKDNPEARKRLSQSNSDEVFKGETLCEDETRFAGRIDETHFSYFSFAFTNSDGDAIEFSN